MATSCTSTTVGYPTLPGFNRFFQTYLSDYEQVGSFFAGNPALHADLDHAAQRAADFPRDRDALVQVLERQNAQWGASVQVLDALQDLREPGTVAVVTGQQLGLFLGPLYTLHKALSALRLAEEIRVRSSRKAVAVFWLHGEDHDFAEVDHAIFPSTDRPATVRYAPQKRGGAVGRMVLELDIERVLEETEALVAALPYGAELISHLRDTWVPGRTMVDAFALTLRHLLPQAPLVFLNPDDVALKRLLAPLFAKLVTDRSSLYDALERDTTRLSTSGYTPPLRVNPLSLFYMHEDRRDVISPQGRDAFRAGNTVWTHTELLDEIGRHPERFSPNVVTRPLAQDTLLPTVAYVGGPGEIAYFAQLKSAYAWAGVPMPILYPRASLTLLDARSCRALDRSGMKWQEVQDTDPERVFHHAFLSMQNDGAEGVARVRMETQHILASLLDANVVSSETLLRTLASTQVRIDRELARLASAIQRADKRRLSDMREGLLHAWQHLFPNGIAQERGLSVAALLAKSGFQGMRKLYSDISLAPWEGHQVVQW